MNANDQNDVNIVKSMEKASVLVVGDIMLDRFVYGKVERISPKVRFLFYLFRERP